MTTDVGRLSLWDTLRFLSLVSLPAFVWGLGAPNRAGVGLLVRLNAAATTARFLASLRQKYRSRYVRLWFPGGMTLLVMDPDGLDAVLASADNAADPELKLRTLSQFVPDSLVVSSGADWQVRRGFNEGVLQFGEPVHRHADAFVQIISDEVARFAEHTVSELRWEDFEQLAQRICHQVILGQGHVDPPMSRALAKVVKRSNGYLLPRNAAAFSEFFRRLEDHLAHATSAKAAGSRRCLMGAAADAIDAGRTEPSTRVPNQIAFWVFVIKDALEINVPRTLALLAAHPEIYRRLQADIDGRQSLDAGAIDGLRYLESCIAEQMRLWTPVPILLRRAVNSFAIPGGVAIAAGEQILFHAGFYHRDAEYFGDAAHRFSPNEAAPDPSPRRYSFSAGRQSCAGQSVARFLMKATLALLLSRLRFELVGPRIEAGPISHQYDHFKIRLRASPIVRER